MALRQERERYRRRERVRVRVRLRARERDVDFQRLHNASLAAVSMQNRNHEWTRMNTNLRVGSVDGEVGPQSLNSEREAAARRFRKWFYSCQFVSIRGFPTSHTVLLCSAAGRTLSFRSAFLHPLALGGSDYRARRASGRQCGSGGGAHRTSISFWRMISAAISAHLAKPKSGRRTSIGSRRKECGLRTFIPAGQSARLHVARCSRAGISVTPRFGIMRNVRRTSRVSRRCRGGH